MDKQYIITQLITAALVIVTTYVTVRLTYSSSRDNREPVSGKLRRAIKNYGWMVFTGLMALVCTLFRRVLYLVETQTSKRWYLRPNPAKMGGHQQHKSPNNIGPIY